MLENVLDSLGVSNSVKKVIVNLRFKHCTAEISTNTKLVYRCQQATH